MLFCILCGMIITGRYKKKIALVESLIRFNKSFLINVQYEKKTIPEFICEYEDENVANLLQEVELSKAEKRKVNLKNYVDKEILKETENYFGVLGTSDSETQKNFLNSYGQVFENKLTETQKKYSGLISAIPKISILIGATFFIALL